VRTGRPKPPLTVFTGIFGLAAYTVTRRMRELGIRVALGAHHIQGLRAALGRVALLLGLGSAAGLLLAAAASHYWRASFTRRRRTTRRRLRGGHDDDANLASIGGASRAASSGGSPGTTSSTRVRLKNIAHELGRFCPCLPKARPSRWRGSRSRGRHWRDILREIGSGARKEPAFKRNAANFAVGGGFRFAVALDPALRTGGYACRYLKGESMVLGVLVEVNVFVASSGRSFEADVHGIRCAR
jgi:hypothetical protein